jgi:Mrp family chromosome partitioning ATPase
MIVSTGTDMANSSESQPPKRPVGYLRRLRMRSVEGAIGFAVVLAAGLVLLGFGAPVYEAETLLGVPKGVALVRGQTVPAIGEVLVVTPDDFPLGYPLHDTPFMGLASSDGLRLRVLCRANDTAAALRGCGGVVSAAGAVRPRFDVLAPSRALPGTRSPLTWPAVLEVLVAALAVGGGLSLVLALAPARLAPRRGGSTAPRPGADGAAAGPAASTGPRVSSAPPVQVFTAPPPGVPWSVRPQVSARPRAGQPDPRPAPGSSSEREAVVVQTEAPPVDAVVGTIVVESPEPSRPRSPAPARRPSAQVQVGSSPLNASVRPPLGFESIPAPPIPEGPLVKASALRDYIPHERVVRPAADERFHALVSRLTWNADEQSSVLGVAGAGNSGPKAALLAARIGWAVAETGKARVLLVDADFDEPQLHRVLRLDAPALAGFSQQLQARLGRAHAEPWQVQRIDTMLDVLLESRFRAHRAAHVNAFAPAFDVFRLHYDVVIAVLPPLVAGSRAGELAYLCDGLVAVAPRGVDGRALRERAVALVGEERVYALVEDTDLGERVTLPPSR